MRKSKVVLTLEEIKAKKGMKAHDEALEVQEKAQKLYNSKRFINASVQAKV